MYSVLYFLFFKLNMYSSILLSYGGEIIIITISKTPMLTATVNQRLSCSGLCVSACHTNHANDLS